MRKNNSIFDSVPNGWCVCGGMIVSKFVTLNIMSNCLKKILD